MKKILALLMAMAMLLGCLAACGSDPADAGSKPSDTGAADTGAPADTGKQDDAAKPGEGGNEVLKIGGLVNQTGWFATYDYNNALEMQCLAGYYNDMGGIEIGGKKYDLEIVVQDGQSDAAGIRSAAQLLADDPDIHYVIETNDFWVEGALDIFEKGGIMNVMSQNNMDFNALNENLKYAYTFYNAAPAQFAAALQFVKDYYPEATKVIFCSNDDGNGKSQAALVQSVCGELGLTYIDNPIIYDAESTDLSAVALQLMSSGADVFIGNADVNNVGSIVKELRNNGSDMIAAAVVGSNAGMLLDATGLKDVSRAFTMGSDLETPEHNTDIFNTIYNRFKDEYGADTAASWCGASVNNLYTLLQLMQGAGSVEVADVQAYYDSIDSVETLFGTGKVCGTETFGCNHVVATPNSVSVLVDGKVEFGGTVDCYVP